MLALDCTLQTYAWGEKGTNSMVANLKSSSDPKFIVDENECYAELWMGTHPSGPASIRENGSDTTKTLADWLTDKPSSIGIVPDGYPSNDLPFLFKVLSVKTALSIQAHPNKAFAAELHAAFPNIYKDPNHKPEMAIALTDFECLCGFRKIEEIRRHLVEYPELRLLTQESGLESDGDLKNFFTSFMTCSESVASLQLAAMIQRIQSELHSSPHPLKALLLRLHSQYPGDRGVFCPLILNYLQLKKGESFFIGANEPHAYISGDCVECMALSDNVVRAGLTPKFKDVNTLCSMLNYSSGKPSNLVPVKLDEFSLLYRPPVDCCSEFEVEIITVPAQVAAYRPLVVACGCILLLMSGSGVSITCHQGVGDGQTLGITALRTGTVLFVEANAVVTVTTGNDSAVFYRAHVNLGTI
mmetsp:Transcript_20544/g.28313  ORF Transcript_20544/g.28313 Transcript_20544/m.28313 type:complete len:413 (+) Transcript_20544:22-1260(+)